MKPYHIVLVLASFLLPPMTNAQQLERAHFPYPIPDGTPPPPALPKPTWRVPQQDVLNAKVYAEGNRTVTVRKIKPIPLPVPPPSREASASIQLSEEIQKKLAEYRDKHPDYHLLFLSVTMYRMEDGSLRSRVRMDAIGKPVSVVFWSSGDFSLLSGIGTITDREGNQRGIMMSWGFRNQKMEARIAARAAQAGYEYRPVVVPDLPSHPATLPDRKGRARRGSQTDHRFAARNPQS